MLKTEQLLFKIYFYGYIKKKCPRKGGDRSSLVIFLANKFGEVIAPRRRLSEMTSIRDAGALCLQKVCTEH